MIRAFPNVLTLSRIVVTLLLCWIQPFSPLFFVLYTYAGFSDVLDGWMARTWKLESEFGAKLDSVADLLFYSVTTFICLPTYLKKFPLIVWICVISVIIIRFISYAYGWIKFKRFSSLHTYLNKLSGFSVFMIPYFVSMPKGIAWVSFSCLCNICASIEELCIHLFAKEYSSSNQSIIILLRKL